MAVVQKIRCKVERIVDHGGRVYTVDLIPESRVPRFRPGQFLHLALDEYDPSGFWPESRVFSIASSPTERERLQICYSVVGKFTTRMEQELVKGRKVWIKLPYGEFIIEDKRDVVLFAGGTGVTAFTAFLNSLTTEFQHQIYLVYGARTSELLIYKDLAQERAGAVRQLHTFYFVEQGICRDGEVGGRLCVADVWPQIKAPFATDHYLSGPPQMLRAISQQLRQREVLAESIHVDAWE